MKRDCSHEEVNEFCLTRCADGGAYEHYGKHYCGTHYLAIISGQEERDRKAADYDRLLAENERLTAELSELKALINDDGSLTTHAEHVEELREAMHAYNVISDLANESSEWEGRARRSERENERLKARLKQVCDRLAYLDLCRLQAQWAAEDAKK